MFHFICESGSGMKFDWYVNICFISFVKGNLLHINLCKLGELGLFLMLLLLVFSFTKQTHTLHIAQN